MTFCIKQRKAADEEVAGWGDMAVISTLGQKKKKALAFHFWSIGFQNSSFKKKKNTFKLILV